MSSTSILIVDDHKIIRKALKLFLSQTHEHFVVHEANSGKEALEKIKKYFFDLVITDVIMPNMDGVELAKRIRKATPATKVMAFSMDNDDGNIKRMLQAGAKGYLLKDCDDDEFLLSVKTVLSGATYYSPEVKQVVMESLSSRNGNVKMVLSKREKEILNLLFQEYSNREIAEKLFISQRTVETHKRNIMEKTGARNLAGLVKFALKNNLFTDQFDKG